MKEERRRNSAVYGSRAGENRLGSNMIAIMKYGGIC